VAVEETPVLVPVGGVLVGVEDTEEEELLDNDEFEGI